DRNPGTAQGMRMSDRYVRWNRRPFLFRTIARSSPAKKERKTTDTAKNTVQMKIWRNGPRYCFVVRILLKLPPPIVAFHPGSSSCAPCTNEPLPLSRKTAPSEMRLKVSVFESYRSV